MKKKILILILAPCSFVSYSQEARSFGPSENLTQREHIASEIAAENDISFLPTLDFWKVDGLILGSPTDSPQKIQTTFIEIPCSRLLSVRGDDLILDSIRYDFGDGTNDRSERLDRYRDLKSNLINFYGSPSVAYRDENTFRGIDAYEGGYDEFYKLKWVGPGLNVVLFLSDEELFIEFDEGAVSESLEMEGAARSAKAKLSASRIDH